MNSKVLVSLAVALLVHRHDGGVGAGGHRDSMGHLSRRIFRASRAHGSGQSAEREDGGLPGHRAADARGDRIGQGLRHGRVRGVLRLGHRLLRARQQHQPLRGVPGEHRGTAGPVVLGLHGRGGSRGARQPARELRRVGGPLGPARVHGAAALGHPRPDRARARGAWHQARVRGRRPEHGGLPARIGPDRRARHLYQRRGDDGAVDHRDIAHDRLGDPQPQRGGAWPPARGRVSRPPR